MAASNHGFSAYDRQATKLMLSAAAPLSAALPLYNIGSKPVAKNRIFHPGNINVGEIV